MEDWERKAKLCGFNNEAEMLQWFYIKEGLGVSEIAKKLNCGPATIANRLLKNKIQPRTRGGANNTHKITRKLFRMDQRMVFTQEDRITAVQINCSPSTVYKYRRSVTEVKAKWKTANQSSASSVQ